MRLAPAKFKAPLKPSLSGTLRDYLSFGAVSRCHWGFVRRDDYRGRYSVAGFQVQETDALGGAAGFADGFRVHADDFAVLADQHDLRVFRDLGNGGNFAVAFGGLHVDDALAAAVGAGGIRRRACACRSRFR